MRTTVNIDDHLLAEAKILAARSSRSLGSVVEDALRAILNRAGQQGHTPEFQLPTHGSGGLRSGVDLEDRDSIAELLGGNAAP